MQRRFLADIGLDTLTACLDFRLAPLSTRRDMAMFGVIHRTILGHGPVHFRKFFFLEACVNRRSARFARHPLQIHEHRDRRRLEIVKRSGLGLCSVYNLLPRECVDTFTVKSFQASLQGFLRYQAQRGMENWHQLFSPRHKMHDHPSLRYSPSGTCRIFE